LLAFGRIHNANAAAAKPDVDFFRGFVVADIVGIVFEINFPDQPVGF
jgi:hypothetical protein